MAAAQPVVYKAMATTGSSRATEAGRVSALKHVDIFCGNKRMGLDSSNPTWIDKSLDTWYPFLRLAIETNIYRRQIVNGDPIAESSQAIGRNLLISINESLMLTGNAEAMKRRLAVVMTFLAVGRSGESALSTWTSAIWDRQLGNLMINWNEKKTGESRIEITY
jgi:hypothetical protein